MAIVTCPDCKRELSDSAISCPNCGYPYEKNYELYLRARQLMKDAQSAEAMLGVAEMFSGIRGFRDSEVLAEYCRRKATVLPKMDCQAAPNSVAEENSETSSLYAILLTIIGAVTLWASIVDGYFDWSFANSSLSGGTRHYTSDFSMLLSGLPIGNLIIIAIFACVAICVLLAWIATVKNKRLELYCVIASSVALGLILICSIIAPAFFTEHYDLAFGFYSHKDFESFGPIYYIQLLASISFLAVAILNRIKSLKK